MHCMARWRSMVVFPLPTAALTFTMGWCGVRGFEDWFALDGLPFFVCLLGILRFTSTTYPGKNSCRGRFFGVRVGASIAIWIEDDGCDTSLGTRIGDCCTPNYFCSFKSCVISELSSSITIGRWCCFLGITCRNYRQ